MACVRTRDATPAESVDVVPVLQALPSLAFEDGARTLPEAAQSELALGHWALQRWRVPRVLVVAGGRDRNLADARAEAVAQWLQAQGVVAEVGVDPASPSDTVRLQLPGLTSPAE